MGNLSLVWKPFHAFLAALVSNLTLINRQVLPHFGCQLHFVVPLSRAHRLPGDIAAWLCKLIESLVQIDYHLALLAF